MLVGPDGNKDVPVPSVPLPVDNELPSKFAAFLKEYGKGSDGMCAVAGVAGPVLAVIHGSATVFGLEESAIDEIHAKARREVRKIAKMVMSEVEVAKDERTLDVALTWCATPIVPTYSVGVHLVLGDLDDASSEVASDLAWVFRLACHRAQIDIWEDVPMLAVTCRALTETGILTEAMLRESIQPPEVEFSGFERAVSADSNISGHQLCFSRGVSPFVTGMLGQIEGGEQPCSPAEAFTWARQCSEEMKAATAAGGLRRQISPHMFNPAVKPPPSPVIEVKDQTLPVPDWSEGGAAAA